MAVSETGQWSGYISGGCLEAAIALEAVGSDQSREAYGFSVTGKDRPISTYACPAGAVSMSWSSPCETRHSSKT